MLFFPKRRTAVAGFTETGVTFNGATPNYLRRTAAVGADGTNFLYFFSGQFTNAAGTQEFLFSQDLSNNYISREASGSIKFIWKDTGGTIVINNTSDATSATNIATNRFSMLVRGNTTSGTAKLVGYYKVGSGSWTNLNYGTFAGSSEVLDFTPAANGFSVGNRDGSTLLPMSCTHYRTAMWCSLGTVPDVSSSTVQNYFVQSSGALVDPNTSVTQYGAPRVEVSGTAADYNGLVNGNTTTASPTITGGAGNFNSKGGTF